MLEEKRAARERRPFERAGEAGLGRRDVSDARRELVGARREAVGGDAVLVALGSGGLDRGARLIEPALCVTRGVERLLPLSFGFEPLIVLACLRDCLVGEGDVRLCVRACSDSGIGIALEPRDQLR